MYVDLPNPSPRPFSPDTAEMVGVKLAPAENQTEAHWQAIPGNHEQTRRDLALRHYLLTGNLDIGSGLPFNQELASEHPAQETTTPMTLIEEVGDIVKHRWPFVAEPGYIPPGIKLQRVIAILGSIWPFMTAAAVLHLPVVVYPIDHPPKGAPEALPPGEALAHFKATVRADWTRLRGRQAKPDSLNSGLNIDLQR